jgi:hypothetical protein
MPDEGACGCETVAAVDAISDNTDIADDTEPSCDLQWRYCTSKPKENPSRCQMSRTLPFTYASKLSLRCTGREKVADLCLGDSLDAKYLGTRYGQSDRDT